MVETVLRQPKNPRLKQFHGMYATSPEMHGVFEKLRRAARADCTVFIGGETGTGKELAAHAIHAESPRGDAPFYAINCAIFSPTLLDSELFGHRKGAFTGAVHDHQGLFARANGGTLFLDEVADIPFDIQGKLLRVLQEKAFIPVGGTRSVQVDVRVVSASNKTLRQEIDAGRFRSDLFYRLQLVPLHLPPLRHRSGEIEALFWHFVSEFNRRSLRRVEGITPAALEMLRSFPWPGNVRELYSAVEYAFVMGEDPIIDVADLVPELRGIGRSEATPSGDHQRDRIVAALAKHNGRRGAAAMELGISRATLWRKISVYGLG